MLLAAARGEETAGNGNVTMGDLKGTPGRGLSHSPLRFIGKAGAEQKGKKERNPRKQNLG